MSMTGQVLMTCELAHRYGFKDVDGMVTDIYLGVMVLPVMINYTYMYRYI